jgi:hypothetical protein
LRDFAKEHTMNKVPYFKVGIFIVQLRGNKPGKDPGTYFPGFRCKTSCKAEAVLKQRDWIDPAMYKLPGGDEWKKEQDRSTRKIVVSKDGNWKNFEHTNKQHHYDVFTEVKNRIHQAAGQKRLSKGHSPQLSFESEPFIVDLADVRQKFTKGDAWMTAPVEYK